MKAGPTDHDSRVPTGRNEAPPANTRHRGSLEGEQWLRQIACEAGLLGGWSVEPATGRMRISDYAARIQGYAHGFAISLNRAIAAFAPEDRPRIRRLFEACARDAQPFEDEFQLLTRDRRWLWVRVIGQPLRDAGQRIVRVHGAVQDIGERKRLQSSVAASNRWFTQVADSLPLVVWSANAQGELEYLNQWVLDYTGIPLADLLGREAWLHIVHPDDLAYAAGAWSHSVRTGEPFQIDYRMRNRHGRYRWYQVRAVATRGADGEIERWVGSATDIHPLRMAEQQARDLGERLTTTLQSITEGFMLLDRDWRFAFVNERAEALLQRPRDELLGREIWEAYPPAVGTAFEREYRKAMATGQSTRFTAHYPPLGKWFEVHAYPSAQGLAVYFQDITTQREEEARRRLLEVAIGQINDIVMITEAHPVDPPGPRIVFANRAFERRMGYAVEDVLGQTPRMLQGADTSPAERARIRRALQAGEPVRAQLDNYTRDGEKVVLELDITPVHDETGTLTHFISVERDVTEQTALQARLEQAQRMESIGQLTGGMAHDFNNLLTVILGSSEILVESLPEADRARELALMIAGASERAASLVQRLLAFARRQALEPQVVDVPALVRGQEALLRQALGDAVALDILTDGDVPSAMVDPEHLENALLNLCMNARDAMPAGGHVRIQVSMCDEPGSVAAELASGRYVCVTVADTGSGIAPEHLERVFEPFFSTRQRSGGTGLGLSMVYGFAKQSRGHVTLQSEPGAGTRVNLFLPTADALPPVGPGSVGTVERPSGSGTDRHQRILVVDDNDLVRDYACEQLGTLGYDVLAARDAKEAIRLLEDGVPVDLVFSDMVMPGMSGADLALRVRALRPQLPILLTSGYADTAQHAGVRAGFPLLCKPYRMRDLADAVARLLGPPPTPPNEP